MRSYILHLGIVLLVCAGTSGLIIPEELPTILSLIYSNIPPIRKGTDSRVGVGFRLGNHADFQILLELGPQIETEKIGNSVESKRRREAMLESAMRGDMGPWAKSVAKFNIAKMKQRQEAKLHNVDEKKDTSDNWLMKWSKGMPKSTGEERPLGSQSIQTIRMSSSVEKKSQTET